MIILIDLQDIDMADEVVRFRYDRNWFLEVVLSGVLLQCVSSLVSSFLILWVVDLIKSITYDSNMNP